ncbi:MAG: hypothetical protein Q4F65_12230 [Propionibacteriaceae bacterium]|nr:hypothetical protein [Propionibacteriaceae bacterium]
MNGLDTHLQPPDDYYGTDDDPCDRCGDTGEVWVDVELPGGRVGEETYPCGCDS